MELKNITHSVKGAYIQRKCRENTGNKALKGK